MCTDKTGTLTKNALKLGDPIRLAATDAQDVILAGALASRAEDRDAIDAAVINGLADRAATDAFTVDKLYAVRPGNQANRSDGDRRHRA